MSLRGGMPSPIRRKALSCWRGAARRGRGLRSPERPSAGIVARNGRVVLQGPLDQAVEDRDQAPAELRERVLHPGRHLRVQLPAGAAVTERESRL